MQDFLTDAEFKSFTEYGLFKITYEDIVIYWGKRKEIALSLVAAYPYGIILNGRLKIYSAKFLREHGDRFFTEVVQ